MKVKGRSSGIEDCHCRTLAVSGHPAYEGDLFEAEALHLLWSGSWPTLAHTRVCFSKASGKKRRPHVPHWMRSCGTPVQEQLWHSM